MMAYEKSESVSDIFGKFIYLLQPKLKPLSENLKTS